MRCWAATLLLLVPLMAEAQDAPSAGETSPTTEAESEPAPEAEADPEAEAQPEPEPADVAPAAAAASPAPAAAAPAGAAGAPSPASAPAASPAPAAATDASGDEDENSRRDVRRNDVLWIEAGVGYAWIDLVQFTEENFLPSIVRTSDEGMSYFGGIGFKVSLFAIGGRVTYQTFDAWDIGTAGLDVTLRIPAPIVEPWVRVGFAYTWMGNPDLSNGSIVLPTGEVDVDGFALDAGAGLDIFLAKRFALGIGFEAVILKLKRKGACGTLGSGCTGITDVDLTADGDATGLMLRPHVHLSLHF